MIEHRKMSRFEMNSDVAGLSPETTFQYDVPYQWGALHVTTRAEESYGFVPLTADTVKGGGVDTSDKTTAGLRTDIYFMSPEEFAEHTTSGELSPPFISGGMGFCSVALNKNGVELRMSLIRDTKDIREYLLEGISRTVEHFGGDIADITNIDGIPIAETIGQDSTQALIHDLCEFTALLTAQSATEFMKVEANKKAMRKMNGLGAAGLAGAGIMLGLGGLSHGGLDIFSTGSAIANMGGYSYLARRSIKRHLMETSVRDNNIESFADEYANMIAGDIHSTYCTSHFDLQAERLFRKE